MDGIATPRLTPSSHHLRVAEGGFTLIELLVVVIFIGILATIIIARFTQTQEKAFDAAAKSDLRNAMSAQEAYFADNLAYSTDTGSTGLDLELSQSVTVTISSGNASSYVMTAKHASSSNTYCVDSGVGEIVLGASC